MSQNHEMNQGLVPIRRALLSVSDKRGLLDLARFLAGQGVELLASGGTRSALLAEGVPVVEVAEYTGQAEVLGGRVKTLHPKIHAGLLARRELADDRATMERLGFPLIDLLVVNLYPFEATVARPGATLEEAIENIDIGGPAMVRSASKNHEHVAVLTSPDQYGTVMDLIRKQGGTGLEDRRRLALAAFQMTRSYDACIACHLERAFAGASAEAVPSSASPTPAPALAFPESLHLTFARRAELRYGENPHQRAAFYVEEPTRGPTLATARVRHGKELSYNNLLDLDNALRLARLFAEPAACILKHNNPCGAAIAEGPADAFERAYEGDPVSAFGGIAALNRRVDLAAARRMAQPGRFLEAVLAPGFDEDAFEWLTTKPTWKNSVRLIDLEAPLGPDGPPPLGTDLRRIEGGLLVQDWDQLEDNAAMGTVPTGRAPSDRERLDLAFAWKVCAAVKSNAIVLAQNGQIVGVGAGQMSRVDSVRIALEKAGARARGAVLASDAFFPFRDGPDLAAGAGVTAIIQPGGSRRDDETIRACDEHGLAMVLTGHRHFRH